MAESMADEKANLRNILKECRSALRAEFVAVASRDVQSRLLAFADYQVATTIVLYAASHNEVATDLLLRDSLAHGRRVLFPRMEERRERLALAVVRDPSDLRPGAFGILEPPAEAPAIAPPELGAALVCVPGLGFGSNGARLGRGGGHYDHLLAELDTRATTVGLAYSFQLVGRIPETASDRQLNYVVTEFAVHRAGDASRPAERHAEQGGTARWNG
jgi:5-formyltetrahydrofolate cyclo-ligase